MAYEGWGAVGVGNVDKREALHGLMTVSEL